VAKRRYKSCLPLKIVDNMSPSKQAIVIAAINIITSISRSCWALWNRSLTNDTTIIARKKGIITAKNGRLEFKTGIHRL